MKAQIKKEVLRFHILSLSLFLEKKKKKNSLACAHTQKCAATSKVSNKRDLGFNLCLHQKPIDILV